MERRDTRLGVVILQHPREDDVQLGTARLVALTLPRARIQVGLSWPSLAAVIGQAPRERWAVLATAKLPEDAPAITTPGSVQLVEHDGHPRKLDAHGLAGIVALDGSWQQVKALWWRNPWLLKHPRLSLVPREPPMYGRLRKAPRRAWVSTLEAVADVLPALGEGEHVRTSLRRLMRTLLQRARDGRG